MIEEVVMFTRAFSKDYFRQKWEWNLAIGVRKLLASLTPREEKVIRMFHGIQENKEFTIKEIALALGCTQKEVKNQIKSAKLKLSQYNVLKIIDIND